MIRSAGFALESFLRRRLADWRLRDGLRAGYVIEMVGVDILLRERGCGE